MISLTVMAVWWEPTQAELADRNGESPFVLPEFLEESNFQHLYKALRAPSSCHTFQFQSRNMQDMQDMQDGQDGSSSQVPFEQMAPT